MVFVPIQLILFAICAEFSSSMNFGGDFEKFDFGQNNKVASNYYNIDERILNNLTIISTSTQMRSPTECTIECYQNLECTMSVYIPDQRECRLSSTWTEFKTCDVNHLTDLDLSSSHYSVFNSSGIMLIVIRGFEPKTSLNCSSPDCKHVCLQSSMSDKCVLDYRHVDDSCILPVVHSQYHKVPLSDGGMWLHHYSKIQKETKLRIRYHIFAYWNQPSGTPTHRTTAVYLRTSANLLLTSAGGSSMSNSHGKILGTVQIASNVNNTLPQYTHWAHQTAIQAISGAAACSSDLVIGDFSFYVSPMGAIPLTHSYCLETNNLILVDEFASVEGDSIDSCGLPVEFNLQSFRAKADSVGPEYIMDRNYRKMSNESILYFDLTFPVLLSDLYGVNANLLQTDVKFLITENRGEELLHNCSDLVNGKVAQIKYVRGDLEQIIDKEWRLFSGHWTCSEIPATEELTFSIDFQRTVTPVASADLVSWGVASDIRAVVELTVTEVNLDSQLPEYMMNCETILPLSQHNMLFVNTIKVNDPGKLVIELNFTKSDAESSLGLDLFFHMALGDRALDSTDNREAGACYVKASIKTTNFSSSESLCEFGTLEAFNYIQIWILRPIIMLDICETDYAGPIRYLVLEPAAYQTMDCEFPETPPIQPLVKIWETRAERLIND